MFYESRSGKNHPDVAFSLNNLAGLYHAAGEYAKALPLYERSLRIREAKLGKHIEGQCPICCHS